MNLILLAFFNFPFVQCLFFILPTKNKFGKHKFGQVLYLGKK